MRSYKTFLFCLGILVVNIIPAQGFLHAQGPRIVNDKGVNVLLKSIGLGGWMLQEGYMLHIDEEGQQHKIKERLGKLIGKDDTKYFYQQWRKNNTRKADIDSLKAWGFNAVRLPIHYNLFTLSVAEEPVNGENTWLEEGFAMTDSLLDWCKENKMYLILDLHAAPGGQGNDLNISDRDAAQPSLWESGANQLKTVALWKRIAQRYALEPWIGGYDLINEPNWSFSSDAGDKNGLKEQHNEPLRNLMVQITKAIREVDTNHLLIIEGNGWGNNYANVLPPWDRNMALSFHKYWNYNDQQSIQYILDLRNQFNLPVWLGETGENSNVWYQEAVSLLERNNIGWSWWPLKKMGVNNPLEIKAPPGYQQLLDYWKGKGEKPAKEAVRNTLLQLAENAKLENCLIHKDVVDALFRQVHSSEIIPYVKREVNRKLTINAVDYDLGRNGVAYFDRDAADYHISMGSEWVVWNQGRTYRNDGVDIGVSNDPLSNGYKVTKIEAGEWLNYTFSVLHSGIYRIYLRVAASEPGRKVSLSVNNSSPRQCIFNTEHDGKGQWQTVEIMKTVLKKGRNTIHIYAGTGQFELGFIQLEPEHQRVP